MINKNLEFPVGEDVFRLLPDREYIGRYDIFGKASEHGAVGFFQSVFACRGYEPPELVRFFEM